MEERKIRGRYLIAFVLTAAIFAIGILVGMLASDYKVNKIDSYQRDIMNGVAIRDTQQRLIESDMCFFANKSFANNELFNVADRLVALENELGAKNEDVVSLKKYYTALEVDEYLYLTKIKEQCRSNNIINLFFYSNDEKSCPRCIEQGFVLTYMRDKDKRLRTYSFDIDLGSPLVEFLMQKYNITSLPAIVFDNRAYNGFQSKDDLIRLLNNQG